MTKSLTERLDRCNLNAIIFNQREALRTLEEDKATLKKQNKKLQEQLKEANEVLKDFENTPSYCRGINLTKAHDYLSKWGVK